MNWLANARRVRDAGVVAMLASSSVMHAPQFAREAVLPAPPRATTDAGIVEGRVDSSGQVLVFEGVPYAAPPIGALRWRAPRPPAKWDGVRPTDRLAHNCMQLQPYGDIDPYAAGVSEDCLYLNVWTTASTGRRPVMVWIHGGGYFAGFGGEERHNGATLARKGVVVVTLNYRLGPFGFLAHPALASESPGEGTGDYGLLDQIAALQWVKRNISSFGGDPSRVTIFGESAGGTSVGVLIASPLAKGLFQRAILESGTGTRSILRSDSALRIGSRVAAALGISGGDAATQLRALNADTVLAVSARVAGGPAKTLYPASIDGHVLQHSVDSSITLGIANLVPVIVGSNADESQEGFGAPSRAFARLISSHGRSAYLYQFTRAGEDSIGRAHGAFHSGEITFVFGRSHPLLAVAGRAAYDSTLADAMSDYWVAFATSGDPNGAPTNGKWPRWPSYERSADETLELGPQIVVRREVRRALYDSLDAIARAHGELRP
ncbi:MAG: carboxylesterase family protein [bacterium]